MEARSFEGSWVAIVTPFDERRRIDSKRLQSLVRWQVEQGTDGIVCCGTTGEAPALSDVERKKILQICLEAAEKRIGVVAGTGTSDTRQTVRLTEMALKQGADGCLVVVPYYNKPSQRGSIFHYQAVSSVGLPFIVYNNPARAVVQLKPETIAEIAQLPHAVAIKESTNDPLFLRKIRALTSFPILAGEDSITLEMMKEGAVGAISVIGNAFPKGWKSMIEAAREGNWTKAKKMADAYQPLLCAMGRETNPIGIKTALSLMGKGRSYVRLPLVEAEESVYKEIRRELVALGLPRPYRPMSCPQSV